MSASKFNIALMESQTQMHRMGLNPFLTFYIDAMLRVDANANANVKCEHTISLQSVSVLVGESLGSWSWLCDLIELVVVSQEVGQ